MYQFFVEDAQCGRDRIIISGSDVNHIKNVLRMKGGERVRISLSDSGRSFFCELECIMEEEVTARIVEEDKNGTELSTRIYLFQGLPKADKMELIIQKAVELGVYEVIPVAMKNCVVKLEEKKASAKVQRWQAIAQSAAKQSKRTIIPNVRMPLSWKEAVQAAQELDVVLVPYENERGMAATREILSTICPGQNVGIFVGPEGGFAPEEIEGIAPDGAAKAHRISLGRRILRTETAGFATLSMLIFCLEQ